MRFETLDRPQRAGPRPRRPEASPRPSTSRPRSRATKTGTPARRPHVHPRVEPQPGGARERRWLRSRAAQAALVFASGMAAGVALMQTLPPGSHVVFPHDAYYGFAVAGREFLANWGVATDFVDMTDLRSARARAPPGHAAGLLETPSNPLLCVVDLERALALARGAGALTLVDNTFATPALQRPLALGADVVLHSTTKYFGGHSDVQGGALVFARRAPVLRGRARPPRARRGRVALQLLAGPARAAHARGARGRAERERARGGPCARGPSVRRGRALPRPRVRPGPRVARRQMSAFGGMLSFRVRGGREAALRAVGRVRLFTRATSLGGVESLIEHRATSEGRDSRRRRRSCCGCRSVSSTRTTWSRTCARRSTDGRPAPGARLTAALEVSALQEAAPAGPVARVVQQRPAQ